jgi:hypothetical protein
MHNSNSNSQYTTKAGASNLLYAKTTLERQKVPTTVRVQNGQDITVPVG